MSAIDQPEPSDSNGNLPESEGGPEVGTSWLETAEQKPGIPKGVLEALREAGESTTTAAGTLVNIATETEEPGYGNLIAERLRNLRSSQADRIQRHLELDKPGADLVDTARAEVTARLEQRAAQFADSIARAMESVPGESGEVDPTGKGPSKNAVEVWGETGKAADYFERPSEAPLAQLQSIEEAAQLIRAMTGIEPAEDFDPHRAQERIAELSTALNDPPGAAVIDLGLDRSLVLRWGNSAEIDLHVEVVRDPSLMAGTQADQKVRAERWFSQRSR